MKTFHCGPVLLQMSPWEAPGLLPWFIGKLHFGLYALDYMLPLLQFGHRRLSAERGFVACRVP